MRNVTLADTQNAKYIMLIYLPENATHNALQAGEYMRMLQITTSKEVILAASSI